MDTSVTEGRQHPLPAPHPTPSTPTRAVACRRSSTAPRRPSSSTAALTQRCPRPPRGAAGHGQVDAAAVGRRRPGTSPFVLVEGNAELTPARLIGHFDPALVLTKGYVRRHLRRRPPAGGDARRAGCSTSRSSTGSPRRRSTCSSRRCRRGRSPCPGSGTSVAAAGFALVAAMNPFDAVGTARVSGALYDRTCRISMGYQSAEAEQQIVRTGSAAAPTVDPAWRARSSTSCAAPATTPTSGRLVGARARSTSPASPSSWRGCGA